MTFIRRVSRYFNQYKISNILTMIKNSGLDPEVCKNRCNDKLVLITGSTSGIGLYTAHQYASQGAGLLFINRNEDKTKKLCKDIKDKYDIECSYKIADFSSMAETKKAGEELLKIDQPIDVMILNAGMHLTNRKITPEGLEMVFAVNYISGFILTYMLKEKFIHQKKGRIIYVNSEGHRFSPWGLRLDDLTYQKRMYSGLGAYGAAKLAQLLSMKIFAELFNGSGVTVNAMHPGAVKSDSGKDNKTIYKWFKRNLLERGLRPTDIASKALYYLGVSDKVSGINGKFFSLTTLEDPAPPALDAVAAEEIWKLSLEMAKLG